MADKGEGWLACRMRCVARASLCDIACSIKARLRWACAPQSRKTQGWASAATAAIRASVRASQPQPAWLAACAASTVRTVLSRSMPRSAQVCRQPWAGGVRPRSRASSLRMLRRLGGMACPGGTEKARPWAWPGPWYGS